MTKGYRTLNQWLASRPPAVRALAAEFPLGTRLDADGTTFWVAGYTEDDTLVVTRIEPPWVGKCYDMMMKSRQYVCAAHVREHNT